MAGRLRQTLRTSWLGGVVLALGCAALAVPAEAGSIVGGTIAVAVEGLELGAAGEVVVFLERLDGPPLQRALPQAVVRQRGARFEPSFLVVAVGQTVEMPNDDVIYHNVFSYSAPNDFDLGLYAAGESRTVRFDHPGLVRIYCSIHARMDGLIFVAPSPLFTRPDEAGRYRIEDVPPGLYRVRAWSERLPEVVRELRVPASRPAELDLELGAQASDRTAAN